MFKPISNFPFSTLNSNAKIFKHNSNFTFSTLNSNGNIFKPISKFTFSTLNYHAKIFEPVLNFSFVARNDIDASSTAELFDSNMSEDGLSAGLLLNNIRLKNLNKLIIGHILSLIHI